MNQSDKDLCNRAKSTIERMGIFRAKALSHLALTYISGGNVSNKSEVIKYIDEILSSSKDYSEVTYLLLWRIVVENYVF